MEYWIVYDVASGGERWRGSGMPGAAASQVLPGGLALVVVDPRALEGVSLDLGILRASAAAQIDAQAEQVRQAFLTPGAGQALTYQRKEAEARAFVADQRTATPFLAAEAAARGMPVADVAAEVITLADRWIAAGALIEGLRMGAKAALAAAETLGAIVNASRVNWSAANPQPADQGAAA